MTAISQLRGHSIYWDRDLWRYTDNNAPTLDNERDCGHCGKPRTPEGHDGCLGTLPGVANACCGHGIAKEAYVQFPDGADVRGDAALAEIDRMIKERDQCQ